MSRRGPPRSAVVGTGGEIDTMVMALMATCYDREESVREAVMKSLKEVGSVRPDLVISSGMAFLSENARIDKQHRVIILQALKFVVVDQLYEIDADVAADCVAMAAEEMTQSKEVQPEWQTAASELLVALGVEYGQSVLSELLQRFEANVIPHFFVVKSLGDFAVANHEFVVPNLKEVFGRLLPLFGNIKRNNFRWVFAATMGRFAEAIIKYIEDIGNMPDQSISLRSFEGEVFSAFEVMFNHWLEIPETKVRLTTVESIGMMTPIMSRDQFDQFLPRLVETFLRLLAKEKDLVQITKGLTHLLQTGVADDSEVLDGSLGTILPAVHRLCCTPPNLESKNSVETYAALLRCFEILGAVFVERVVSFLLGSLEGGNPSARIGTLVVFRHIVSRLDMELETQKELIVSGVRPLLPDDNLKVRKAFAELIVEMAEYEYLELEGGQELVEFIVANAGLCPSLAATPDAICDAYEAKKKKGKGSSSSGAGSSAENELTPRSLRALCDDMLERMTTTVPCMVDVLWPFLLETIDKGEHTDAQPVVCRSLAWLAGEKLDQESEDYYVDFDRLVNLPKPPAIIARLLVLLSSPLGRNDPGKNILECLDALSEVLHPMLADLWADLIPKLLSWLDKNGNPESFKESTWEELVQRFIILSIDEVNDDDWTVQLGTELAEQYALYSGEQFGPHHGRYKRLVHKLVGLILRKSSHKKFVREMLATMFDQLDFSDADERQGWAQGYGFAAASHLDSVTDKLQSIMKNDMIRKSAGMFGFRKDKSQADVDNIKTAIMLAFGYVTGYADVSLIASRVEVHIIAHILPQFADARPPQVREAITRSVEMIAKSMHPAHLEIDEYNFKQRSELLANTLAFAQGDAGNLALQTACYKAFTALTLLQPVQGDDVINDLVTTTFPIMLDLDAPSSSSKKKGKGKAKEDGDDDDDGPAEVDPDVAEALAKYNDVLGALLYMNCCIGNLNSLFRLIEPHLASANPQHRQRATDAMGYLLGKFIEFKLNSEYELEDSCFVELGHWLGVMIPRCADPVIAIRETAIEAVDDILMIDFYLMQGDFEAEVTEEYENMETLKEHIGTEMSNRLFQVVNQVTSILSETVSDDELPDLLQTLTDGLNDPEDLASSGTCVVLNGLIRSRGEDLDEEIATLLHAMIFAMTRITSEQTMNGTLHALRTLAAHHLVPVIDELLATPMPHSEHVIKSLVVLAKDDDLAQPMIAHLIELIVARMPYETRAGAGTEKIACTEPTAATAAMAAVFLDEDLEDVAQDYFSRLLSTCFLRIGLASDVSDATARDGAVAALRAFLTCAKEDAMAESVEDDVLKTIAYPDALVAVARALYHNRPDQVEDVFKCLLPFMSRNYPEQRVVAAAVISEFINLCTDDGELLSRLMNALLVRLVDEDTTVKIFALRGLGNVASAGEEEVNRLSTTVMSALMSGMDATEELISLEAMSSLSRILSVVDGEQIAGVLTTLCLRLRPMFKKDNSAVRSAAITLFGTLARFGSDGDSADDFYDQTHSNMVSFLLAAHDEDELVRNATLVTLGQLAPLMQSDEVSEHFDAAAAGDMGDYYAYIDEAAKIFVEYYGDRLNQYVLDCVSFFDHPSWFTTKGDAAMFVGYLLNAMDARQRKAVSIPHVCGAIRQLLKEPSASVRSHAAEAIALLYEL